MYVYVCTIYHYTIPADCCMYMNSIPPYLCDLIYLSTQTPFNSLPFEWAAKLPLRFHYASTILLLY